MLPTSFEKKEEARFAKISLSLSFIFEACGLQRLFLTSFLCFGFFFLAFPHLKDLLKINFFLAFFPFHY